MTWSIEILAWIGNRIGKPPGWERVVRLFASPEKCRAMRAVCVVQDDLMFITKPSVPIGWHVAFFGTYEPELRRIFRAVLPLGGVAIDVGANVGWHTLLMARLVGNGGTVLAVEPNPSVRLDLEINLKLNCFSHVAVIPYAIADSEKLVDFFGPDADDAGSGDGHVVSAPSTDQRAIFQIETQSLDTIVAAAAIDRVDLIKIDVEGFEWPALQGAQRTIQKFRPHVVFEYIDEYASRGQGTPEMFERYFGQNRYRLFLIKRNWAEALDPHNWPKSANIWAVPF